MRRSRSSQLRCTAIRIEYAHDWRAAWVLTTSTADVLHVGLRRADLSALLSALLVLHLCTPTWTNRKATLRARYLRRRRLTARLLAGIEQSLERSCRGSVCRRLAWI